MAPDPKIQFPPRTHQKSEANDASDLVKSIAVSEPGTDNYAYSSPSESHGQYLSTLPISLVGVSSKAYFSHSETLAYVRKLLTFPPTNPEHLRVFFIPSFPGVSTTSLLIQQQMASSQDSGGTTPFNLLLGAQDCHFAPAGAHTGSVPASELAELGCSLVELGHAERRRAPLHESDDMTAAKAQMAVASGLVPLLCIGEKTRPADPADAMSEMRPQIDTVLQAIGDDAHIVLAYEPVWAIGQKDPAPADYVCSVVDLIRESTINRKGAVRILYGGSAKPGIWSELKGSLDGLFLGRFAHNVDALGEIIKEMGG